MLKKILLLILPFSLCLNAQVKITGKIIDSNLNQPVADAHVSLLNTQISGVSNEDGAFEINATEDLDSLKIWAPGYAERYIPLEKGHTLQLIIDILGKEEVKFGGKEVDSLAIEQDTLGFVKVTGRIVDKDTQQPVSGADIYLKDTSFYTFSDDEGRFELEANYYIDSLQVSSINLPTKFYPLQRGDNLDITVSLSKSDPVVNSKKSSAEEIETIVIKGWPKKKLKKKENPAYTILKEVWKRRRSNGLTNFKNYQYKEYEKIEFDLNNIDSTFINKKIFQKLNISARDIDTLDIGGKTYIPVFINESITDVVGQNFPAAKKIKEFLRANQASGIPNNDIVSNTVKNLYKDVNIYDNVLNFFNKGFTSPVATIGFSVYDYMLIDTLEVEGTICYHIKYRPLRANELTFKGDLFITKDTYAVKEVSLQSASGINVNFVKDIYMELEYDVKNDSVFIPLRNYTILDMSLLSKKNNTKGMFAKRTLTYNDYKFDVAENEIEELLDETQEYVSDEVYNKGSEYWAENRPTQLTEDEKKAYDLVEKVAKTKAFRNIVDAVQVFSSGYINVGKAIDIGNLYQSVGFNDVEGFRLRAGARTYFSPNDMWRIEGYGAYGFKDEQFKYGGEARVMFNRKNRFTLGVGTKRDVEQLGVSLTENEGIMSRSFASSSILSRGDNNFLSSVNKTNAFISIEPWKNVQLRLDGAYQYIKSANPTKFNISYYDRSGNVQHDLYDTHFTFSLQLRPGAKYSRNGLDRYEHTTLAPTLIFKYVKGLKGVFDSDFDYDKLQFLYSQPILWGPVGRTNVTFEFGKTFSKLPLSLLGVIPGNQSYGIIPNTFSQLNYYDFVTDIYSALHIEHHFNGRIFSYIPLLKKLQFREVVFFRGVWGDISDGSKSINASNILYVAPKDDIYYEYGFGIENIGLGNLRIFRIDFNWRGNYMEMKEAKKFGVKVGMQFSF